MTFCQTEMAANLAVASVGSGPVLVRAAHWGTHVEYACRNPLTSPLLPDVLLAISISSVMTGGVPDYQIGVWENFIGDVSRRP